jgi:hypothetical protein
MNKLVVLEGVRKQRVSDKQERLIDGLKELLQRAQSGSLKGICYACIASDDETLSFGVLHTPDCGVHELVGLSQILNDRLLQVFRDS